MKPRNPYVRARATRRTRFEDKREALRLKALRGDAREVGMDYGKRFYEANAGARAVLKELMDVVAARASELASADDRLCGARTRTIGPNTVEFDLLGVSSTWDRELLTLAVETAHDLQLELAPGFEVFIEGRYTEEA